MYCFTDYPIEEFGDTPWKLAPIRECEILSYDGDKYCLVRVEENDSDEVIDTEIKLGYLYQKYGRFGDVPSFPREEVRRLIPTSSTK